MPRFERQVHSSHVDTIGYDPETKVLRVKWDGGKVSLYEGVPESVATSVANSWSVGKALTAQVKGKYNHRYE